ncbi:type IV secretion system protein [Janibacter melonis]|uniref:type IV secretion system protein n=1 Tax=Janibacter melonis TaxID=262209 RepID=UPI0020432EB1|nr:type IV secretion system protein [Janibacter melonis]MCM3556663.1 type IV secretion system protein [Janibacter melonis]
MGPFPNPFDYLGTAAGKVAADAWTSACLGIFNAGMWLLQVAMTIVDYFTTPDLSEDGPGRAAYETTFWLAVTLMVILTIVQLGAAAFRRDGKSLAQILIGTGQFLMIWIGWIAYGVAVVAACGGLTKALMRRLLHIEKWAQFEPLGTQLSPKDVADGTIATVLAVLGLMMVLAAVGHILVMLTRAGALIVISATTPISAAGLSTDFGRSWFWKSFRWFHAAAFTPVLMVLVLGIGVQFTAGAATGIDDDLQKAIGTALPGVLLILMSCFCPMALFKLLAFTDPGTTSGAAMRAGMAAQGGVAGLLGGSQGGGTSSAASASGGGGRSQGEASAEAATTGRFSGGGAGGGGGGAGGFAGKVGGALGPVGKAAAAGVSAAESLGNKAATIGADVTNQMGVGHNQYVPDFSSPSRGGGGSASRENGNPDVNGSGPKDTPDAPSTGTDGPTSSPPTPLPSAPTPSPQAPGSGGPSAVPNTPGAGGAGAGAGAGAAVPPVV